MPSDARSEGIANPTQSRRRLVAAGARSQAAEIGLKDATPDFNNF
jgi:hypothetical protein